MNVKKLFLEAAKAIDSNKIDFSCSAVSYYSGLQFPENQRMRRQYTELMTPVEGQPLEIADFVGNKEDCTTPEAKQHRVIALLFAGEVLGE